VFGVCIDYYYQYLNQIYAPRENIYCENT